MCKWGTSTPLRLWIPAHLSRTGEGRWDTKDVDSCIAPLVEVLNSAGIVTQASCCGHGKMPGNIVLADGRELAILPDFKTSRRADYLFVAMGFKPINPTGGMVHRLRTWPRRALMRLLARLLSK